MPTLERIFIWMVLGTSLMAIVVNGSIGVAHTMSVLVTFAVGLRVYHDRVVVPLQSRVFELECRPRAE